VCARGLCGKHYQRWLRHGSPDVVRKTGPKTDHDMAGGPEYRSWEMMKQRCLNPNSTGYARYGGLGITVWPEWVRSFRAFYEHIGPRPEGTSLDRYPDPAGNYEPGNVRWATRAQQNSNSARRNLGKCR
jgi:hypothetical protein